MTPSSLAGLLAAAGTRVTVLTGAGISAESGIPTFRGRDGYWTVGSSVYMPEQMATLAMFSREPAVVWEWYLYRLGVCLDAEPNPGHTALVTLETRLGNRFTLITQNIDNLHIRAGNSRDRTYQIHGNINYCRCSAGCSDNLVPLPEALRAPRRERSLTAAELQLLRCPGCRQWLRPHVLWFDEMYDEHYFRFDSSLETAAETDLLVVVGTSGATTLPNLVVDTVYRAGATIVDINPQRTPFTELALASNNGGYFPDSAAKILPAVMAQLDPA